MKKATLDQAAKILALFAETPRGHVQELLSSGLLADLRDGNLARVDRDTFRRVLGLKPLNEPLLVPLGLVAVGPLDPFNPREFYTTRKGLYVWPGFAGRVLPAVGDEVCLAEEINLSPFTLTEHAADAVIRENLPESHVFEADELCAIGRHLIEGQPNGKEGHLLSNGYANLFYVKGKSDQVFVVDFNWYAVDREWDVHAWGLAGRTWPAGCRVFSRNC